MGYQERLFLGITFTLAMIIALAFILAVHTRKAELTEKAVGRVEQLARTMARQLGQTGERDLLENAQRLVDGLAVQPVIGRIQVDGSKGREVVWTLPLAEAAAPIWFYHFASPGATSETEPIVSGAVKHGTIEVAMNEQAVVDPLWVEAKRLSFLLLSIFASAVLAARWAIHRGLREVNALLRAIDYAAHGYSHGRWGKDGSPQYRAMIGVITSMERETIEAKSKAEEEQDRLSTAITMASAWYWEKDVNLCFSYVSDGVSAIGVRGRDLIGKPQFKLPLEFTDQQWDAYIEQTRAQQPFFLEPLRHGDRWFSIRGEPVFEQGEFAGYRGICSDVTGLEQDHLTEEGAGARDALTQLANRHALTVSLKRAIEQSRVTETFLAVCSIDLDGFKDLNDAYGHSAGDSLLVEVARRLKECVRVGDTVSRVGGDEFVIVLTRLESEKECQRTIARVLNEIARTYQVAQHARASITASMGVTLFPLDDSDPDGLLRHAAQAMFEAKAEGKNRYHLFDPKTVRIIGERTDLLNRVSHALERDELVLFYQPKVDLWTGEIFGYEALLRWQHPDRGLVPPNDFLPGIEGSQISIRTGYWVIERALRQLNSWLQQGEKTTVSVNVPAQLVLHGDFVREIRALFEKYPAIVPRMLQMEILESVALKNVARAHDVIEECQQMGITFALDDFGTGYSSLTYLKRLGIDEIKIDQSFVRTMLSDSEDFAIVEGMIGLAESFNCSMVAEGVETLSHGVMLRRLGCRYAQGYGIARPMPAQEVLSWARTWRLPMEWDGVMRWHRADIPLLEAQVNHLQWLESVRRFILNPKEMPRPSDVNSCKLSKWLTVKATKKFRDGINQLEIHKLHNDVHRLAAGIILMAENGKESQASSEYHKLHALGTELVDRLYKLSGEDQINLATQVA